MSTQHDQARSPTRSAAARTPRLPYATLDQLLQASTNGMRIIDKKFRVLRVNDAMTALSGVAKDEAEGKKCHQSFPGPHCFSPKCPTTRILAGEQRVQLAVEKQLKDGTAVPCLLTATPFRNDNGRLVGVIEEFREVSELSRVTKALKKTEGQFRSLVQYAPNVIMIVSCDGTIEFINRIVHGISASVEETVGRTLCDFMDPEYHDLARTTIEHTFETGQAGRYETSITTQSGRVFWFEVLVGPITNEDTIVAAIIITVDVTERKHAELSLRQSEAKHCALLDAVPDLMFRIDKDGVFLELLPAKDMQSALEPSQFLNRNVLEVMPAPLAQQTMQVISEVLQTGATRRLGYRLPTPLPDGEERDYEARVVASGEDEVLAIVRDITRRKRAEDELRNSEERHRSMFDNSPIPLREEDHSRVKRYLGKLQESGITNLRAYLEDHPAAVADCAALIKVIDANRATVKFYGATDKSELLKQYTELVGEESYGSLTQELVAIAEGMHTFECQTVTRTLVGEERDAVQRWQVVPGCEDTYSRVLVSVIDLTRRKQAEEALRDHTAQLRRLLT